MQYELKRNLFSHLRVNFEELILGFHKGGRKDQASQYRPIALISHLAKILEKVVRIAIIDHLNLYGLMDPNQHGSRKGRSTLSQLLIHQAEILDGLIEGANVDNVYIDFSKAYDKVDHNVLLRKVKRLGIDGKVGKWIASIISDRPQKHIFCKSKMCLLCVSKTIL